MSLSLPVMCLLNAVQDFYKIFLLDCSPRKLLQKDQKQTKLLLLRCQDNDVDVTLKKIETQNLSE